MRVAICFVLVAVAAVRVSGETADAYENTIVNTHNDYRRLQNSTNINQLSWDDTLAQEANAWVGNCVFAHEQAGRGENLAYNTATGDVAANVDSAMAMWYNEINIYTYGTIGSGGAGTGHYTQMIWGLTRFVGCAMEQCAVLSVPQPDGTTNTVANAWFFGCWYEPPGNYIGEYPYLSGTACTECWQGQTCENDLCAGEGQPPCVDNHDSCVPYEDWGACVIYPAFMLEWCPAICGFCNK